MYDPTMDRLVHFENRQCAERIQRASGPKIYERLYHGKAKGGTVYVDGSRDSQVLSLTNDEDTNWAQMDLVRDFGVNIKETQAQEKKTDMRADRIDRNIGVEVGDICPICLEGVVEEIGGCNTCTNCNAQLKCGL